jgi:glycolate oxidase iron-sulfur subunit
MAELGLRAPVAHPVPTVAYHSACSMQHGQKLDAAPIALLRGAGFRVVEPAEAHLCCGSAGTYNILQPELATRLGERKAGNLAATGADLVATGNIGCIAQLGLHLDRPTLHTVELLDWATGGPLPPALAKAPAAARRPTAAE